MCLIMLAVWFNESLLKKIGSSGAIFQFLNPLIMPPYFHDHSSIFHDTLSQNQSLYASLFRKSACRICDLLTVSCILLCMTDFATQLFAHVNSHDHHVTLQGCDTQMYLVHSQICRPKHVPPPCMKLLQQISPQFPKKTEEFCIAFLLFCFNHYFIHTVGLGLYIHWV